MSLELTVDEVVRGGLDALLEPAVLDTGEMGDVMRRASDMSLDGCGEEKGRGGWRGSVVNRRIPVSVGRNYFDLVAGDGLRGRIAFGGGIGRQGRFLLFE
jgi:hypothetical protein